MSSSNTKKSLQRLPMYKQLANLLRQAIKEGTFADGKLPGERELADRYQVSGRLASRAVDILVEEGLLYRIPRKGTYIAGAEGQERRSARPIIYINLPRGYTEVLRQGGLMIPETMDMLRLKAEEAGYDIMAHPDSHEDTWRFRTMASSPLLKGALAFNHVYARRLRATFSDDLPVVCFDHGVDLEDGDDYTPGVSYVTTDNIQAGRTLARYLLRMGHRRIVYVRPEFTYITHRDREQGCRNALEAEKIMPLQVCDTIEQFVERYKQAADEDRPTACIVSNDHAGVLALNTLTRAGIRVPEDISLTCFDDLWGILSEMTPEMTTMAMPLEAMASLAWSIMTTTRAQSQIVQLPYTLIERNSVTQGPHATWP